MTQRLDYMNAAPDAFQAVLALETYVAQKSGLDKNLIHLIKLRASHINGCAFCIDMHTKECIRDGISPQKTALVPVWHESSLFSEAEQAALAWTETVTNISQTGIPDADYERLRAHFNDDEIVKLTVAIGTINVWNRLAVGFRHEHPVDS